MRKGTVCTRDTGAGSPGGWGMERRGEGARSKATVPACTWHQGSLCCENPQVCAEVPAHFLAQAASQQAWGDQAVLRPQEKWPPGRHQARGSRKWDHSPTQDPPSKAGEFIPRAHLGQHCAHPEKGLVTREGLGSGPCHPGLFSGQELGIKIDNGGRS